MRYYLGVCLHLRVIAHAAKTESDSKMNGDTHHLKLAMLLTNMSPCRVSSPELGVIRINGQPWETTVKEIETLVGGWLDLPIAEFTYAIKRVHIMADVYTTKSLDAFVEFESAGKDKTCTKWTISTAEHCPRQRHVQHRHHLRDRRRQDQHVDLHRRDHFVLGHGFVLDWLREPREGQDLCEVEHRSFPRPRNIPVC